MISCLALMVVCFAVSLSSFARQGIVFDWQAMEGSLTLLAFALILAGLLRRQRRLSAALLAVAWITAIPLTFAPLSYAAAGAALPLQDGALLAFDRVLGFDWLAYVAVVGSSPALVSILGAAYGSMSAQLLILAPLLAFLDREAGFRLLAAYCSALSAAISVAVLVPAAGVPTHLGLSQADFPGLDMHGTFDSMPHFFGLRDGSFRSFSVLNARGIVAFPSFHTAAAILYIQAAWQNRLLRWPVLLLNAGLIAGTPVFGGHYLVDLVAGAVIAATAYALVPRLDGWMVRFDPRFGALATSGVR